MPRVEVLTEASRCDPEVVLIEHLPSEIPADEPNADQLAEHTVSALEDADPQEQAIPARDGSSAAAPPVRSVRRATARRASNRRATARSRQADSEASIIAFLLQHAGSTAGDLAKSLNLSRPGLDRAAAAFASAACRERPRGRSRLEHAPRGGG
jgi:hypothetical protein